MSLSVSSSDRQKKQPRAKIDLLVVHSNYYFSGEEGELFENNLKTLATLAHFHINLSKRGQTSDYIFGYYFHLSYLPSVIMSGRFLFRLVIHTR